MKSTFELPPNRCKQQFVRELQIGNVTSLDQLHWPFDGSKVSPQTLADSKPSFINELRQAQADGLLTKATAEKLLANNSDYPDKSVDDFINEINIQFSSIFTSN